VSLVVFVWGFPLVGGFFLGCGFRFFCGGLVVTDADAMLPVNYSIFSLFVTFWKWRLLFEVGLLI